MKARLKLMRVGTDGTIHNAQWIDDQIIRKISVEETVGDEFWVKSSEIKIEIAEKLPLIMVLPLLEQWIALYYDDVLFNVYKHPGQDNWLSRDDKTGVYQYRLFPLQKIFYDHLKTTALEYSSTASEWNYGLDDAFVEIDRIEIHNDLGAPVATTNRWGFAIPRLIETLLDKHNGYSYKIGGITHFMITPNDDDLAILWRGSSKDATGIDTEEEMINFTFKQSDLGGGEVFNMTWLDIFKLVIFGWNSFVLVTPTVDTGFLLANIDIIPKVNLDEDSPIAEADVKFMERKKIRERYKIGGVSLTGLNFSWTTGDITAGNVVSRSFDIADYSEPIQGFSVTLYWAAGNYNSGDGQYELTAPYFGTGLVAPYYLDLTTDGSGYEARAKLLYEDGGVTKILRPLDQIEIQNDDGSTEIFHVTTIRTDGEGIASIEGMVINPS